MHPIVGAEKPSDIFERFQGGIVLKESATDVANRVQKTLGYITSKERSELYFSLIECLIYDVNGSTKDVDYVANRARVEGFDFFTKSLPSLAKELYKALSIGYWSDVPTFGRRGGNYSYPRFLSGLFAKIFLPGRPAKVREDACPSAIKAINQICQFFYKADVGAMDPQLVRAKLENLVSTEEEISSSDMFRSDLLERDSVGKFMVRMSRDMLSHLPSLSAFPEGRNGPGAVADLNQKECSKFDAPIPYHPKYLDLLLDSGVFFNDRDMYEERSYRWPSLLDMVRPGWANVCAVTSSTVCVPKDARGPRVIGKEPWVLQYLQQGLKSWLYPTVESSFPFGGYVNFEDQSVNQQLVRSGSVDKKWSTLDLKDASDRVTLTLVRKLFAGNPALLNFLEKTRSEMTSLADLKSRYPRELADLPDSVPLGKFAPMGSALCFPVMAVSVYCACLTAISYFTDTHWTDLLGSVYVYGDDIVVKTEYVDYAKAGLRTFGLVVNDQKSFVDSFLLESCGVDCYRGWDVSPVRLRSVPSEFRRKDDSSGLTTLAGLCAAGNTLVHRGYITAGATLLHLCEKAIGRPLPFCGPNDGVIGYFVHDEVIPYLSEVNYLDERVPYTTMKHYQQDAFKAFAFRPVEYSLPDHSVYGHLCRIWGNIGKGLPLPQLGVYTAQKQLTLKRVLYAPNAPSSSWLPLKED